MRPTVDVVVQTTAGATVTTHLLFALVEAVYVLAGGATSIAPEVYTLSGGTIVPGTPTASQVQFAASATNPSNTLTFGTALAANSVVFVVGVADGDAQ